MRVTGHRSDSMLRRYGITSIDDKLGALRKAREYAESLAAIRPGRQPPEPGSKAAGDRSAATALLCKLGEVRKKSTESESEPRWPVLVALFAVAGMYLALPEYLTVEPSWFLPAAVGALAVPTLVFHRTGRHRLDRTLGFLINSIVTAGLIASIVLLLTRLPARKEAPGDLLRATGALWATNVVVFALWYWRLDAGGPHRRDSLTRHTEGAFFFPQMIEGAPVSQAAPWSPRFIDYLFIAFNTSAAFSPTDTPVLDRWAKVLSMLQAVISLLVVVILGSRAVGLL